MKIQFTSNYGNFDYRFVAEVPEGGSDFLQQQGLANIAYRSCGSAVDKALGVKSQKQGGNGRTGVLYSEQDAQTINATVSKQLTDMEKKEPALARLGLSFAVTGQHVFGETDAAPTKEATDLWVQVQQMEETAFAAALAKLGIDPENYDDDTAVLACRNFLLAQKREAMEKAKAATQNALGLVKK